MSKYLKNYENLDVAKADETIVSPNVTSIANSKILHLDTHVYDEELIVIGDNLANARIVKKYIADTASNPELIALAKSLGWIDSGAEKMSVLDAMAVTTVNGIGGHSLLSNSGLKSFDEFEWFTGVTACPGYNENDNIASLPSSCTSIKLPESISSIVVSAFRNCTGLASVTIPNSVTSIGEWAFAHCTGLASVTIPNSVTSIGGYAFYGCSGLTSVTIPDSVTSIGDGTFYNCTSLTSVKISNSVTNIGWATFYYCNSLTSVEIPDSVTNIGNGAFQGCSSLASVTIPNNITSIGTQTFQRCTSLTSVTIPNSVTSIGDWALGNCSGLTSIVFTGTSAQWCAITRGSNWHGNVPATTVYCEGDGVTVSLDATA